MNAPILNKFSTAKTARTYKLSQSALVLLHVQSETKLDVYNPCQWTKVFLYTHSLLQFQFWKGTKRCKRRRKQQSMSLQKVQYPKLQVNSQYMLSFKES